MANGHGILKFMKFCLLSLRLILKLKKIQPTNYLELFILLVYKVALTKNLLGCDTANMPYHVLMLYLNTQYTFMIDYIKIYT